MQVCMWLWEDCVQKHVSGDFFALNGYHNRSKKHTALLSRRRSAHASSIIQIRT